MILLGNSKDEHRAEENACLSALHLFHMYFDEKKELGAEVV